MPVEPLLQTAFAYLFLATLVIISLLLFRYLLTALKAEGPPNKWASAMESYPPCR